MNKTILITGSSSGIGKAAAKHFAGQGWNVIATMRELNEDSELETYENILRTKLDVQDQQTVSSSFKEGIARFGSIDLLLNNAGYGEFGLFEASTQEDIHTQFDVNVFGVMRTIREVLPHFRERGSGMIINVSSGAGRFTLPLISLYAASKFALEGFSEALYFELSALNIKLKIIEPGGASTNFSNVTAEKSSKRPQFPDYDNFSQAAGMMFNDLHQMELVSAEEVAAVIFQAATDGADTLRYVVGNEDFTTRINARQQLPDEEYLKSVKDGYLKYLQ
ncbi:SDR family oxidoreductase [Pedobacter sp. Leaf194]|uniref:SDR family oxidoreductase n=1 Tax=Pedobacter sp. Leaf194 TaxID=1736297 RepID=UPI000703B4DF|nr:SDR family oxidoreductase [Pedobacter sp. Leaf194]KQS36196.1 short-chain dehydrogenase [Pedobacter sp. Leaf194]